jgi:hypothetical protein
VVDAAEKSGKHSSKLQLYGFHATALLDKFS